VVLRPGRPRFTIARERGGWRVVGRNVERWVHETDLDDERALVALQRRLIKEGVERQLAKAGARRGDEIRISDRTFEFLPEVDRLEVDPREDRRQA
jgi:GTP-binding protein